MKIRPAASSALLEDVMKMVVEVPDWNALLIYLQKHYDFWNPTKENITIKPYCYDKRTGWDTYLICVNGNAALFSDGPMNIPNDSIR